MITLRHLARALRGEISGDHVLAPGPGHSSRDRSMSVWVDPTARGQVRVHSFAGDDWQTCRQYAEGLLGMPLARAPTGVELRPLPKASDDERTHRALELWNESVHARGSVVALYLESRGLNLPDGDQALRYHPSCPFSLENREVVRLPAMIALFRDIHTDRPVAIHRTALKPDGNGKAEIPGLGNAKKMLGPTRGAAIKLDADADVSLGLGIAEGIENGLVAFSADWHPIWVCGFSGAIRSFPVLHGVDELTIFGDADTAGTAAARACQSRWALANRLCTILLPKADGCDWNDVARAA